MSRENLAKDVHADFLSGFEARLLRAVLYFTTWLSSSRYKGQKGNLPFFCSENFAAM